MTTCKKPKLKPVWVQPEQHKAVKQLAADLGLTMGQVVAMGVKAVRNGIYRETQTDSKTD